MPRRARVTVVDAPHHVCQRSLNGRTLFSTDADRAQYLAALAEQAQFYKADILAYCLMKDRVHLVLTPHKRGALSKVVGRTQFWYAQYHNRRRKRAGKLWHDRFHSCVLDDRDYLTKAVQFVESQPVYDKLVRKAEKYPWSSAAAHIDGSDDYEVLSFDGWPTRRLRNRWTELLSQKLDEETCAQIRLHTQTGRPWGSPAFIAELERRLRRRLHALPVGRPPKNDSK